MTTLYLTRHGESEANKSQILQGQTPGKLTENGIEQARALQRKLADTPIDAFVASDLHRAIQTCKILADAHGCPVTTTVLLRERDWGSFTGRFIPDLKDAAWPDDIETLEQLQARARNFLTWIKVTFPERTVLAVGHGIINKAIQSVYMKKPMSALRPMDNAEVRILML